MKEYCRASTEQKNVEMAIFYFSLNSYSHLQQRNVNVNTMLCMTHGQYMLSLLLLLLLCNECNNNKLPRLKLKSFPSTYCALLKFKCSLLFLVAHS